MGKISKKWVCMVVNPGLIHDCSEQGLQERGEKGKKLGEWRKRAESTSVGRHTNSGGRGFERVGGRETEAVNH